MALNYVPGVNKVTIPVSVGVGAARSVVGEETYQDIRGRGLFTTAVINGIVPINPVTWIPRIAIMIVVVILLTGYMSTGWAIFTAVITQAALLTLFSYVFIDKFMSFGMGI